MREVTLTLRGLDIGTHRPYIQSMNATQATITAIYAAVADRAASTKGLRGRAKYAAECARSCAIHAERARCAGMTEEQALARLAELTK